MNRETIAKLGAFLALVGLCVVTRLLPHPPNFTPVASAALFAGFYFNRRLAALAVPVLAVLVSDAVIGGYSFTVMLAVYAAHLLPVLLGTRLASRLTTMRVAGSAVLASLAFFIATNLAVWNSGVLYERTAAGLLDCFTVALPFYQHTLLGNLFWSAIIFGSYAVAGYLANRAHERRMVRQPVRWQ